GLPEAFVANLPFNLQEAGMEHSCTIKLSLNGSEQLMLAAVARENKLEMQSSWPNPSFTGAKLPDTRDISSSGFKANWKFMNRTIPQVWKNTFYNLSSAVIGADLFIPVDSYDKTERSVKYAL